MCTSPRAPAGGPRRRWYWANRNVLACAVGEWDPQRAPSSLFLGSATRVIDGGTVFSLVRVAVAAGMGDVLLRSVPAIAESQCGCPCPASGIGWCGLHGQSGLSGGGWLWYNGQVVFPLDRLRVSFCAPANGILSSLALPCLLFCYVLYSLPALCVALVLPSDAPLFFTLSSLSCVLRSLKEFASFFSKTLAKRVPAGGRSTVEHDEYLCHVHSRSNGLVAVALCDREYPSRVAFTLLSKLTDDFLAAFPVESSWHSVRDDGSGSSHTPALSFPVLDAVIEKYQDPAQADPIMKIQKDLDDTKVILHKTIDGVLERGVKLDSLVEKSNDLSLQSKMFYKQAKSQNSCCSMM